jgi:regulator of protease activity HflC (stomatin/prohibitin superfamily)
MENKKIASFIAGLTIGFVIMLLLWFALPVLKINLAKRDGEAKLAYAESERQTKVREAQATFDSAKLLAQAEVERAKGVAEANKIIADGLKNNENYLKYLQIQALENTQNQVIYIPTEASLPILEGGKRK